MKYVLDGTKYEVIIIKKNNKNTYIRVKNDLKIYVTTHFLVSKNQIQTLLDNNIDVLRKMIEREKRKQEKEEQFIYLGNIYNVIIVPSFKCVEFSNNYIYTPSIEKLEKWLKKETIRLFQERLDFYYNKWEEKIPYPKLKIRKMTSRWGVCNRKNNTVTLNSELMKYGVSQIDYVVVHELSHFVHFDHSKLFWATVCKYCPKYKEIRKSLKEG